MFGDIGWSRGESNPQQGAPQQQAMMPMSMPATSAFAFGGLVDAPGYYQQGGVPPQRQLSPEQQRKLNDFLAPFMPRVPLPRPDPRYMPQPEQAPVPMTPRPPIDLRNAPTESELEARQRMAAPPPRSLPPIDLRGARVQTEDRPDPSWVSRGETGGWPSPNVYKGTTQLAPTEQALPPASWTPPPVDQVYPGDVLKPTGPRGTGPWFPPGPAETPLARGGLVNYQGGGGLGLSQMNTLAKQAHFGAMNLRPSINPPGAHLIHSAVPGRVDRIPMRARSGSFILPADVVSGLGQGNTYAGAKMWGQALSHSVGPAGVTNTIKQRAFHAPPMPSLGRAMGQVKTKGFQRGGEADELTPIVTSGGEMIVDPEIVEALGNGDPEEGKKQLINSLTHVRKQIVKHIKNLPGPVQ
jgi:hypothetical protein